MEKHARKRASRRRPEQTKTNEGVMGEGFIHLWSNRSKLGSHRIGQRTGRNLLNINVCYAVFGIFGDCESDGGDGNGFAEEPADSLL